MLARMFHFLEGRKKMWSRLTHANVAATLALVFAMTGGAVAAQHYLINSTRQISPKVLKRLRGATGGRGAAGAAGVPGPPGAQGKEGPAGHNGERAPSNGYESIRDGVSDISNAGINALGDLTVPAGTYLASAKLSVGNRGAGRARVICALSNNVTGDKDKTEVTLEPTGTTPYAGRAELTLQAGAVLSSAGVWTLGCYALPGEVESEFLKIQAIQLGALSISPTS
jgi:hypothetical protein